MDICFEGVGQVAATFQAEGEVQPGMTVTLTKSGCVGKGTDGKPPCGVVLGGVRCGSAAVQIGGTVKVGYTGAVPTAGWQMLACDGQGGIKVAASGGLNCLVLATDESEETAVIKL